MHIRQWTFTTEHWNLILLDIGNTRSTILSCRTGFWLSWEPATLLIPSPDTLVRVTKWRWVLSVHHCTGLISWSLSYNLDLRLLKLYHRSTSLWARSNNMGNFYQTVQSYLLIPLLLICVLDPDIVSCGGSTGQWSCVQWPYWPAECGNSRLVCNKQSPLQHPAPWYTAEIGTSDQWTESLHCNNVIV